MVTLGELTASPRLSNWWGGRLAALVQEPYSPLSALRASVLQAETRPPMLFRRTFLRYVRLL